MDFTWKTAGKSDTGLIAQQARPVNPAFYKERAGMIGHVAQYPLSKNLARGSKFKKMRPFIDLIFGADGLTKGFKRAG